MRKSGIFVLVRGLGGFGTTGIYFETSQLTGSTVTPMDHCQPEVAAHVVRCGEVLEVIRATNAREKIQTESHSARELSAKLDQLARAIGIANAPATFAIAIHLEERQRSASNGNAHGHENERRGRIRKALAIPV